MWKYLWPIPLLAFGLLTAFILWPSTAGWMVGMLCLLLVLPLSIVVLRDGLRRRDSLRFSAPTKPKIFRRSLFNGTPIARLVDNAFSIAGAIEILQVLLTVVFGILIWGYVTWSWWQHWIHRGEFLLPVITVLGSGAAIFLVVVGIPAARIAVTGVIALCGFAFLLGYQSLLLPYSN